MNNDKKLPKWADSFLDRIAHEKYPGIRESRRLARGEYMCAAADGILAVLSRLEATKRNDFQRDNECPDCFEDGRQSIRQEVLNDE